jgi:4-amino-4-deoxy-L-arabinose transferase-like glycosyltransferase
MAPAVAALIGAGTVAMFTAPRRLAWTLPAAVAVTGGWAFVLLRRTPSWNPWLPWLILAVTVPAVTGLVIGLLAPGARRRLVLGAVVLGLAGSLAGPAAFAASSALSGSGNGTNPTAGPSSSSGMGGMPGMGGGGSRPFGGRAPAGMGQAPSGTAPAGMGQAPSGAGGQTRRGGGMGGSVSSQLISYLEQNQGSATWLVAVSSAQGASSAILSTGKPVIAMGGFTGSDPAMTVAKLQQYVKDGKLKYVLLGSDNRGGSDNSAVTSWIKKNGTVVKASEYGASASSSSGTLYRLNG